MKIHVNSVAVMPMLFDSLNYTDECEPLLPARERRRISPTIKTALAVAQQALDNSDYNAADLANMFCSSGGDFDIFDYLCRELSEDVPNLSPTKFHNSLLNSAAGYWNIATGSLAASSSSSANQWSFSVGFFDAALYVKVENKPILLVAYDLPPSKILQDFIPSRELFATAMVLSPEVKENDVASVSISLTASTAVTTMQDETLEILRQDNAASKSLPLLQALLKGDDDIVLDYPGEQVLYAKIRH